MNELISGFGLAVTPENILAALIGALIGTAVGILPGLGPTVAISLLLVPTAKLSPETGLIVLGAVFYGTQYGDSMLAILLNVPSEPAAMVIGIDGHQLAKRGRAGPALALAAVGSFTGAFIGLIGLGIFAPLVGNLVFRFGPVELAAVTVLGLAILVRVSSMPPGRSMLMLGLGLLIGTVGLDQARGLPRFTFGSPLLLQGFELVPVVLGLVGMTEVLEGVTSGQSWSTGRTRLKVREMAPTRDDWRQATPAALRGSVLGFFLGLLPGPTLTLAAFTSYRIERLLSTRRSGSHGPKVAAVAGPKAADDAAVNGNMATLLTLGLPFTAVTGVLFAGFELHGVQPGPLLIRNDPRLFWALVAAMFVGNVALLVLNFPLIGIWMGLLRIPRPVLSAALVPLLLVGSFSLRNSTFDMMVTLGAGVVGYLLKHLGFDRIPVVVGLILGPLLEQNISESLQLGGGHLSIFVTRPVSLSLVVVAAVVLGAPTIGRFARGRHGDPPTPRVLAADTGGQALPVPDGDTVMPDVPQPHRTPTGETHE